MRNHIIAIVSTLLINSAALVPAEAYTTPEIVVDTTAESAVQIATGEEAAAIVGRYNAEETQGESLPADWTCTYSDGRTITVSGAQREMGFVFSEEIVRTALENYTSEYDFATTGGDLVNVETGTLEICPKVDYALETQQLNELYMSGESVEGRVPAMKDDALGNTYVEVSLDAQHMWVYQDGELVIDTDVTTGDVNENRGTPRGAYYVYFTDAGRWLRGSYAGTFYVDYWMRITQDGIGLHDAQWRTASEFGGDNYISGNGSHGCINIPTEEAGQLFSMCYLGLPVVIY